MTTPPPPDAPRPPPADGEVFHAHVRSVCPSCLQPCDAARVIRDGRVYLITHCPEHGPQDALVSSSARWFLDSYDFLKPGSIPLEHATSVDKGCPDDCGLCPDHEQHTCLPIVEITNRCNLSCPICFVDNRGDEEMTRDELGLILDSIIEKEGLVDTVNLSGGEPTLHPQLLELIDEASRPQVGRVSLSTNGLLLAEDPALCRELARRGAYVNLQFDCLDDAALLALRGRPGLDQVRLAAIDNLEAAGAAVTLIAVVARGVNEHLLGDALRLLMERDAILSLMIQPLSHCGPGGGDFAPHDPTSIVTIPEIIDRLVAQCPETFEEGDFVPLPCSHPSCFALSYLLKTPDDVVPFPRFIDMNRYLDLLHNRGIIQPDVQLEDAIREAIDTLWSGTGQIPDAQRILTTLKRALRLMYPPDRVLELEQRLRIGESLVKTVFIHAFMDAQTFELERLKRCCNHYALPDGRLLPGCAQNVLHRRRA